MTVGSRVAGVASYIQYHSRETYGGSTTAPAACVPDYPRMRGSIATRVHPYAVDNARTHAL